MTVGMMLARPSLIHESSLAGLPIQWRRALWNLKHGDNTQLIELLAETDVYYADTYDKSISQTIFDHTKKTLAESYWQATRSALRFANSPRYADKLTSELSYITSTINAAELVDEDDCGRIPGSES